MMSMEGPQKPNAKSRDDHGGGLASSLGTPDEPMPYGAENVWISEVYGRDNE